MAGSVVDGLLASSAGATSGVSTKKPKMGGTLTVGLASDVPNYHAFNGAQGKMDQSGFCVANALYDALFVSAASGKGWLPMLALSATPNKNYTVWTVALRHGVTFTNGDAFNAAIVVANYQAAAADTTVGLAIQPIIKSCVASDAYTVVYTLQISYSSFPYGALCEQQTCYMAHPSSFSSTFAGNPIGTGPFKLVSWEVGFESKFKKNKNYWRSDAQNRRLPYLDAINFKTIADPTTRNTALQTGAIDMMLQQDATNVKALAKMHGITYRTDAKDPTDPSCNCLILNTTGTLNQYFCWAGEFQSSEGISGGLSYIKNGQAIPTAVQMADYQGTLGAVDPSSLQWNTKLKPVLNDPSIRKALAMAINRTTYFKVIDSGVGAISDGVYRHTSPNYKNPHYPAYNPSKAKSLVSAYKSANSVSSVGFVIDIIADDQTAQRAFAFFEQQIAAIGITVTPRPLSQSALINNVILGEYDCAQWNQFGGLDPALNYVWFNSFPAAASPAVGGLGMTALPANVNIAGAVNFAHQGDPVVEDSMLKAMALHNGSPAQHAAWAQVNAQFSKDIPYLFLDFLTTAWAARDNVQNWAYATAGDGRTRCLNPDSGSTRWDQIWKS
jgi:ABC-type transport system substrate-binding protein